MSEWGGLPSDVEYARRVRATSPGAITTYALQNSAPAPRDILALAASNERLAASSLLACLRRRNDVNGGWKPSGTAALAIRPILALAKLLANQFGGADDHDAVLLYEAVVAEHGISALTWEDKFTFLELLAARQMGEAFEEYATLLEAATYDDTQFRLLRANVYNPFRRGLEDASDPNVLTWLEEVNTVLATEGLEPIGIGPGVEPPMDRILCAPATYVEAGPLVTVIVPTYDPGPRIATAMESLRSQSYQNLQILVMNDGTPQEGVALLDRLIAEDSRVRVVHLPENGGTYKARNIAVSQYARGSYVTVHDDDDWSHPRKIEIQVRHLEENRDVIANTSMLSRSTDRLVFGRINNNPLFTQRNYSSLMLRREVFDTLGYWDVVNRSADAEMYDRIVAATGYSIPMAGHVPLSLLRIRDESLTSGEIYKGYVDARRMWYQRLSRHWHSVELSRGAVPKIPLNDEGRRPFPAPLGMLVSKAKDAVPHSFDIVYGTDFRFPGGNSSVAVAELTALVEMGYRVAILQMDSPLLGPMNELHSGLLDLLERHDVPIVSLLDNVNCALTVIRHPTVLQYARPVRAQTHTESLVVIINHAPLESGGARSLYGTDEVVRNAEAIFGPRPVLAPESPTIRNLLASKAEGLMTSFDWAGVVIGIEGSKRTVDSSRLPIVGRHSRDAEEKWPDASVLSQIYPTDGSLEVRVLGGAEVPRGRIGDAVEAWTVYPFGSMAAADFLRGVDFWIYFHSEVMRESFGMAVAEALASGAVTILPHYMRTTFGNAAVYCAPEEVQKVVRELWTDRERFAEQSRRGMAFARNRFTAEALRWRIDHFVTPQRLQRKAP